MTKPGSLINLFPEWHNPLSKHYKPLCSILASDRGSVTQTGLELNCLILRVSPVPEASWEVGGAWSNQEMDLHLVLHPAVRSKLIVSKLILL